MTIRGPRMLALFALGAGVLVVLGDLFFSEGLLASHRLSDGPRYFYHVRDFGFGELSRGHLPLWNPFQFSGTPFVGNFQSAMLYPPNLLYLVLPTITAINVEIALHLFALGAFTWLWLREAGRSAPAALVAAFVVAFGAATSLRVLAGQLSVIDTIAWFPLLLLAIDRLTARPELGGALLFGLASALMLLAGHPPTALMGFLAAGLYGLPPLLRASKPGRTFVALVAAGGVALLLAGAQLGAGYAVASESVREGGVSFDFATTYSFSPENLLTYLAPKLFGDADAFSPDHEKFVSYFGRWWYWDENAFIGIAALSLGLLGLVAGERKQKRVLGALFVVMLVLALGRYTPVYRWIFEWLPGFDLLRAPSKFLFFANFFASGLVALGADVLLRGEHPRLRSLVVRFGALFVVLGLACLGAGLRSLADTDAALWPVVEALAWPQGTWSWTIEEGRRWSAVAGRSLVVAGATSLAVGLIYLLHRRVPWMAAVIVGLACLELVAFARWNRGGVGPSTPPERLEAGGPSYYDLAWPGRVLELSFVSNHASILGRYSAWGYDPVVLARTERFMGSLQSDEVDSLDNVLGEAPGSPHPLLALMRTHYAIGRERQGNDAEGEPVLGAFRAHGIADPLPRFLWLSEYRVLDGPEEVIEALHAEAFDPRREVLLESPPRLEPAPAGAGASIEVLSESTDHVDLAVTLAKPAILLMTDAYSEDWRLRRLDGPGGEIPVQPANVMARAVALEAGEQRLRFEYRPRAFEVGLVASALGGILALVALVVWVRSVRAS